MAIQTEAWYREMYLSKITHKYKNAGFMMKPMVQPPSRMDGKKLYFPVASPGTATETRRGQKVGRMNTGRELKEVTAKWYEAPDVSYDMDEDKIAPSEMEVYTKVASDALGQVHDKAIMTAIHTGRNQSQTVVGDFSTGWDLQKALTATTTLRRRLQNPKEQCYCVLPQLAFAQMLTYEAFSNSEYVGDHPLSQGVSARTWGKCHWVEGYDDLFVTASSVNVTFYVWFMNAVGSGDSGGIKTKVSYLPEERGWLHDNMIEIGATVLLPEAIQECRFKGDSAITFQ